MRAEENLKRIRKFVNKQAEDEGLWFQPDYITEAYLQQALRELHELIEDKTSGECAVEALNRKIWK